MRSIRREQSKARTKSRILTKGGVYDYDIDLSEISILAKLISQAPGDQLPLLLDALLTKRELVDITRRIIIGQMIIQQKTYEQIYQATRASRNTIASVNQSLSDHDEILQDSLLGAFRLHNRDNRSHPENYALERYFANRIKKGK